MTEHHKLKMDAVQPGQSSPRGVTGQPPAPIIAVQDLVVFPNTTVGFRLTDASRIAALQAALPTTKEILLLPLDESETLASRVGKIVTRAQVLRLKPQDADVIVFVEGMQREQLLDIQGKADAPYGISQLEPSRVPPANDAHWLAAFRNLRDAAIQLAKSTPAISADIEQAFANVVDPATLTDLLSANLELSFAEKRQLLDTEDVVQRVDRLQTHVNSQLHIASLQEKLRGDVNNEFSDAQRRTYLREQLRAIQRELGEADGNDETIAELQDKLTAAGLPENVRESVDRDVERLERLSTASPDYAGTLDYLQTVADLPWSTLSMESIDLASARATLDADHHGLDNVKRRLIEYLAVRKLNPEGRGPLLCLVGPPGVGKTSLGQSVANALGRKFARVALGGVRDEAEIRGHRRTYVGAMMGRILQEISRAGTRNPVIMLDEIDKMGADFRGDPASALLEVLDPAQNHAFTDHYLNLPFDLSQVIFITTANVLDPIPAPLRDRMEVIRLSGYTPSEKRAIAERYLVPRQMSDNGLAESDLTWTTQAIDTLIQDYTREAGVRLLEQRIGAVVRAQAALVAQNLPTNGEVDVHAVTEALGPPDRTSHKTPQVDRIGVVHGLAYTPVGGDVLSIEALRYAGSGQLRLTGQLGSVMQESAQAAESLMKSQVEVLGITGSLAEQDTHLHVPDGAVPKDGPSAGAAMFLALASLHSHRPVRGDIAMTGEINLRGDVQPIGGLPEKTLAALAAGIKTVLIPKGNAKDIEGLPEEVKANIELILVEHISDVVEHALLPSDLAA